MSKKREESEGRRGDRKEGSGRPEPARQFYSKFNKEAGQKDGNTDYDRRERSFDKPRGNRSDEGGRRFDDTRPNRSSDDRPRFERSDDRRSSDRQRNDSSRNENPRGGRFEGAGPRRESPFGNERGYGERRESDRNQEDRPRFNRDENRGFRRNDSDRPERPRFDRNDERPERSENRGNRFEGGGPRRDFNRDREERPRFNQDENRGFRRDSERPERPRFDRNDDRPNRDENRSRFGKPDSRDEKPRYGRPGTSDARNDRFGGERSLGARSRNNEPGNDSDRPERRENRFGNERGYGERRESGRDREERPRFNRDENRDFRRGNDRFEGGGPRRDDRESRPERPRRTESEEERQRKIEDSRSRQVGSQRAPEFDLDKMKEKAFGGRDPRDKKAKRPGQDRSGSADRNSAKKPRDPESTLIRLNRYIANSGICSRRDADELIARGDVSVNGKVVTEMGYKVKPTDVIKYGSRVLNPEKMTYVLLNKPKDYITTTEDPEDRHTVMELVAGATPYRIYPVGRLDRNTTGLLLLTNDGELVEKLTHPSNEIKKVYQAELDKPLTNEHFEAIRDGFELEDGYIKPDDLGIVTPDAQVIGIEIHSGRNRIVRRIFEHFGYEVTKLDRTVYAGLTKKELPRGSWRYLDEKEVIRLKFLL
ncbi:pseudouridine synthase [Larkinella rosea]|uniref:Pseudouridine synthase n=1 Tax=Larkinella rosea TaxID=2025312 RepID=A0A3P1BAQ7_9BACT|nr:pseudouridine synthase [Larkinella rosea]RRA97991.1 pseudouridine synthase [Larkinella rosea]